MRPTIQEVVTKLKSMISSLNANNQMDLDLSPKQQAIQQFKLNHGLFLDGYSMKHSKHAVVSDDGELDISLYNGQPLVYTFINDHKSRTNLLAIYPDHININKVLKPSDICILFPV